MKLKTKIILSIEELELILESIEDLTEIAEFGKLYNKIIKERNKLKPNNEPEIKIINLGTINLSDLKGVKK